MRTFVDFLQLRVGPLAQSREYGGIAKAHCDEGNEKLEAEYNEGVATPHGLVGPLLRAELPTIARVFLQNGVCGVGQRDEHGNQPRMIFIRNNVKFVYIP